MTEKKSPVISFKNFTFQYRAQKRPTLMGINLDIYPGERVLIAGPSGCGKSTLAGCINGLNPFSNPGECTGELTVDGVDAPKSSIFELSAHVGTVLQDPDGQFIGLTVGEDIAFALENSCTPQNEMHEITRHAAELVGIENHMDYAPHELSGGMRQRVMIAMALACEPDILIADEPTTALDVTIQAQILELMQSLQEKLGMAIIMVTHDLGVIASMCDEIIVMYGGRVCERGTADAIFYSPAHEYTKGLLRSIPTKTNSKTRLVPIGGTPINMLNMPDGCAFCPRCDAAMKICLTEKPEEIWVGEDHLASCWMNIKNMMEEGKSNE